MKDKLIIIGASGHGKVVADIAIKMNKWQSIAFLDDDESIKTCLGFHVIGKSSDASNYIDEADFFIAIGNNEIRERVQENLLYEGFSVVILVHPDAVIGIDVQIGIGTVVMAGVVVNSSTRIGKGCIINTSSSLDHDNSIEDYVHISPGTRTAGSVAVGKGSWLGIGSTVSNNINICSGVTVGAGAVVVNDICSGGGVRRRTGKKDIVIIGAGGFGKEVAWLIEDINKSKNEWNIIGFVDDDESVQGKEINGYRVVGNINWLKEQKLFVVNAIGNPIIKKKVMDKLDGSKNKYPVLIHPSVIYSERVTFGEGSIICAGSIITVNVKIGKHVIINLDCTVGHDANLGDYTTVLPGVNISGYVKTGEYVNVGTGTVIIQGINICKNTVIGAGSVVVRDLPANCTAVGVPAKPIKFYK